MTVPFARDVMPHQAFAASPEAQSYDRLMTEIEEAGS